VSGNIKLFPSDRAMKVVHDKAHLAFDPHDVTGPYQLEICPVLGCERLRIRVVSFMLCGHQSNR
jgi:hypothetical protein